MASIPPEDRTAAALRDRIRATAPEAGRNIQRLAAARLEN
jgi:hypothetical protein